MDAGTLGGVFGALDGSLQTNIKTEIADGEYIVIGAT